MTPERSKKATRLYHAALTHEPGKRAAFWTELLAATKSFGAKLSLGLHGAACAMLRSLLQVHCSAPTASKRCSAPAAGPAVPC